MSLSPEIILLLLFGAAFLAGFIDSIAGGGGLIAVPALLLAGLTPLETLATNKLQSLFGSGSATIAYAQKGYVDLRQQAPYAFMAAAASVLGAFSASLIPGDMFRAFLPILLIVIALYFALKPNMTDVDRVARFSPSTICVAVMPFVAFYDGIFGPGAGSFYMLAFIALAGFGVLKATAHTKLLNFASNVGAFAAFSVLGVINWKIGLIMAVGQFFGARLGAAFAMKRGAKIIKPLLVIVCTVLAVKLLTESDNPLRVFFGI
ncbi:MAG: TSUP family transporter [Phyllobacterium sp.]